MLGLAHWRDLGHVLGERAEWEETGQLRRLGRGMLLGQEKEKGPVWVEVLGWGKGEWASGLGFQLGLVSSSIFFLNSNQTNTIRIQIQI